MKIRMGFVSNSSSSSFIIRGARYSKKEFIEAYYKKNKMEFEEELTDENIQDIFHECWIGKGLQCEDTRFFFDGDPTDDCIVGKTLCDFEDGDVVELPEPDDEQIKMELKKFGLPVPEKLSTFAQYISNDNY